MTTQIALLNPSIGEYEFFDNLESAKARFPSLCEEFFLLHTHNTPFSQVVTNNDGSQTWSVLITTQ
jgi:hypothetical protein